MHSEAAQKHIADILEETPFLSMFMIIARRKPRR